MKRIGRISIPLVAAVGIAFIAVPGAGAQPGRARQVTGDRYAAAAESSALRINVLGQGLSVGSGETQVTSEPKATAKGVGLLLGGQNLGASEATATKVGESSGSDTPTCGPLSLPSGTLPGITLDTSCSTSSAKVTADGPSSKATGQALTLSAGSGPLLEQTGLDALVEQLVGQLQTGLAPVLTQLPALPLPGGGSLPAPVAVDVLKSQLLSVLEDGTLVAVKGGGAVAQTSANGTTVSASSRSLGAQVDLLDRGAALGGPVLTIKVGSSSAQATRDRVSGQTSGEFSAVPVTIIVAPDIAALLGLPTNSFEVPGGQAIDLPLPAPLNSTIIVSSGKKTPTDDGLQVESAALELQLAKGLPNGGIVVGLSSGSAAVAGAVAPEPTTQPVVVQETTTSPAPVVNRTLPRTGVEQDSLDRWGFGLLAVAAGAAFLVILGNRRARRSTPS